MAAPHRNFKLLARSQAEEDAYNFESERQNIKSSGNIGSIAHLVKGALGAGIMGGHVGYMKAGLFPALFFSFCAAVYIWYSLHILVRSAQILYRRTRIPQMSYPDVGEAAMATFPNPSVAKWSKIFRYTIDTIICIDLFGSCACYQLIIAFTLKQLFENTQMKAIEGLHGHPNLRVYLALMIIPCILICLITELKYLAPFSLVANFLIMFCIGLTIYYSTHENPTMTGYKPYTNIIGLFEFLGMSVFSLSCSGIVLPVTNNMKSPTKYGPVLFVGMCIIYLFATLVAFFGYMGYLEKSVTPVTLNFPMELMPNLLKGLMAFMIYVTHALNFFVPFNLCFYYIKPRVDPKNAFKWELFYRALFVLIISLTAIAFPNIDNLMGFLGAFCLSNMAFIWPSCIELLVVYSRPGYGTMKWRLWKGIFLIIIGTFLLILGSGVNLKGLVVGN